MNLNSLALAYLGDAIYDLYIREYLIKNNIVKVNQLQKEAVRYVSANNQSKFLKEMLDNNFFNKEEIEIIKRARNHKSHRSKSTDIITYKYATALEAIIGHLYLENNMNRIDEIMRYITEE